MIKKRARVGTLLARTAWLPLIVVALSCRGDPALVGDRAGLDDEEEMQDLRQSLARDARRQGRGAGHEPVDETKGPVTNGPIAPGGGRPPASPSTASNRQPADGDGQARGRSHDVALSPDPSESKRPRSARRGKRRSPEIQAYIKGLNGNKRTAEKTFWTMASVKQQLIPELIREVDSDERTNLETVRRIGRISCVAEVRPF